MDEAAQLFDRSSLLALLDGDTAPGSPPAAGKVRERLLEVQQVWEPFSADIQTAVVFLVIFMVVLWLTRRAVGPVEEMAVAAGQIATVELAQLEAALQAVAGGDLTQAVTLEAREIEVDSADEVGRLARAFNQMEQRLQEAGEAFNMTVTNLHRLHEESIAWAVEHAAMPYRIPTPLAWQLLRTFVLPLLLLTALLVFPLWFYLKRSVLRPLHIMVAANQAVTEGWPEGRMIPDEAMPAHELGQIMRSRNQMLARLEAADADLRRRLRELSALNSTAIPPATSSCRNWRPSCGLTCGR